jgi:predicted RNA-binding Zn-ribbon protein involved in translation (DUF1610 family)
MTRTVMMLPVSKKKTTRTVLTCPQCGSADLYYEAGLITGYKYHCKNCGYIGAFVIEKDLDEETGKE